MAWRAISETDLLTKVSGDELTALREAALADGQADPIAAAVEQVTDMARGYIAANPNNTLGDAGTVPERVIGPCVDILVIDIGSRVAGTVIDPNDARRTARATALQLLRDIAAGRFAVEPPGSAADYSGPAVTVLSNDSRQHTRDTWKGL